MKTLDDLRRCEDVPSLRAMVQEVAGEVGAVKRLDILTSIREGWRQAICFLRMQTPEQEAALMKTLGVGRFGGEVVFVVDLQTPPETEEVGPSSQWTDFGAL